MTAASRPGGVGTVLRTVRNLRFDQLLHQVAHRTLQPLIRRRASRRSIATPRRRAWAAPWDGPVYLPRRETSHGVFTLHGVSHPIQGHADWNHARRPRLWLYECHYLDDLAAAPSIPAAEAPNLLDRWIDANPPASGVGWEPYPLSRRIVNIVKYLGANDSVTDARMHSLARQTRALEDQIEYHLRGNHLLANAKALVFAGALCAGPDADRWLRRGTTLLVDQIREQFLADGGHFERSPMYHGLLVWDLCDVVELALRSGVEQVHAAADGCRPVIEKGLAWFATMCHPDGDVSFFNDSTGGVAPTLAALRSYAERIDTVADVNQAPFTMPVASGFHTVDCGPGNRLLIDLGSVGPDYQPGHAHAGTLSLELSIGGRRTVVNSGISTYTAGVQRSRERGTAAHSTVQIDDADSSEVWSSFRVGRRAKVTDSGWCASGDAVEVWGTHDGYTHLPGRPLHTRRCIVRPGRLDVVDRLSASVDAAVARFFLHPDVRTDGPCRWILPDGGTVRLSTAGGTPATRATAWHPGFGTAVSNQCVEISFVGDELLTQLHWEP